MAHRQFGQFIQTMTQVMETVNTKLQRDLTLRTRVARRFSLAETAEFIGLPVWQLTRFAENDPAFPDGQRTAREVTFSPAEVMQIRALLASDPAAKTASLHWRAPGDPVKVVTFGAQKGGTGKSLTAAHFAQYVNLHYGLRVGVIDADPQATISLYFADSALPLFSPDIATLADFMGVADPGATDLAPAPPDALDAIWQPTPWPGMRLIPGGPNIQNGDISLFFMSQRQAVPVYRVLKDAIATWDQGYGPRTQPADLRGPDGAFDRGAFQRALTETVDVIVIDQQPSLTLMQLNGLVAADSVVIPQTMKGFDLATLSTYVANIADYLDFITNFERDLQIGTGRHMVLPTIVQEQNNQDTDQIVDLYRKAPQDVMQVWYGRSDAIANASEEYKSIYEYQPPKSRRSSARAFLANANAVNDDLVRRIWPDLPEKGFAEEFIKERWS